ncbi:MAG: hypothetical protein O3A37_10175 [Planctomycetota bacterium]|nr:hypothetical protein [Planctomycetota bacterium]
MTSTFLLRIAGLVSQLFLVVGVVGTLLGGIPVRAESFPTVVEETAEESVSEPDLIVPRVEFMSELAFAQGTIQDPAIETVDEMDTRRSVTGGGRPGGGGGQWWDSIRDPSIRTVDEQTYGDTKSAKKTVVRADQHSRLHAVSHQ